MVGRALIGWNLKPQEDADGGAEGADWLRTEVLNERPGFFLVGNALKYSTLGDQERSILSGEC